MYLFTGLLLLLPNLVQCNSDEATLPMPTKIMTRSTSTLTSTTTTGAWDLTTDRNKIPCACPLTYSPVCGSDGRTYSNECILACISDANVRKGKLAISLLFADACPPTSCFCPISNQPVCGSNNQTYSSECVLECENNWRRTHYVSEISVAYRRSCEETTCMCPAADIPVCGTDGRTYKNICFMQCQSLSSLTQPLVKVRSVGPCPLKSCECPNLIKEVCGSDNVTYKNECELNCANEKRIQLGHSAVTLQYRAKCVRCVCNAEYTPVCANNDFTYANYCQFLCTNEKRRALGLPELLMRWRGDCTCGCTRQWSPVCASDRRTYANRCYLRCENRKRYQDGRTQLTLVAAGPCQLAHCNCDRCSQWRDPVCGSDGRTYWNQCYLQCNNACRNAVSLPPLTVIHKGHC